jgi:AcrR family transcriptional regulator
VSARTRPAGDRTRERILDVALPLFADSGFAGTSVRAIASAAEVNVATLAYHFTDKEGLYDCVVQRLHEDLARAFPSDPPVGTPQEVLRGTVAAAWAFTVQHRQHVRLLVRHVLDHGAQPQVILDQWSDRLLGRADALLAPFRPEWPAHRRRLLVLSLMHLTVRLVLEDPGQLARMSGIPEERLEEEVVAWLGDLCVRELGLPG